MLDKYGTGEHPTVCPTETKCDRFQSAAGKTHAAKVKAACSNCELLPTKRGGVRDDVFLRQITSEAMQIRYERLAGYPRSTAHMSTIEFAALPIIEQMFEREDRRIRMHTKQAIFAMARVSER